MPDERRESPKKVLLSALPSKGTNPTKAVEYCIKGDCWICTSHAPGGPGYPRIRIDQQLFSLPRFICLLFNGPGVVNECVLHSCDNPMCINPAHLSMGSYHKNNQDMHDRGRGYKPINPIPPPPRRGESNNMTKLTERDVRLIRWVIQYMTQQEIADAYGIDRTNISCIVRRKTWKHVK